ncbi:LIM and calponin homology domains-containing protein 1a isoform X2 [Scophthalmus maximus]|uniref:LIM and calponin homology domains-containing protein 1a isoform X2 n=1 Tax=Scophthalmus maximus TaxID=52904 RepID=UPI001FA93E79|nr:LIM and calponin homology domains-containing protein 1a isoform X2 [Scophthalmus maximus]
MASPAAAGRDGPTAPTRDEPEEEAAAAAAANHPEPAACQEAQQWIEAVTGKSFGDKDFRSALENGILLCELLSAIKPGLVKKINRLPTPIAGLDNLSVFLRGCEELGLRGSQLFDPGDLQDTSTRANLKDSDCNRKLKNVLNTVFWLGKAASGCASFGGPTLNLKEFEGLLSQMKMESDQGGDNPQKHGVRDSGYDCWDSERSESLSPPRHTRDNSLDSLDSFGSRSQHSPSPDVVNRGNSDGRGSDSEADGPGRKPDVRKDDMLARRTASSEARSSIPFNQFLPNRTNASCYIPTPRRKPHAEEGEQRSQATPEQGKGTGLLHKSPKTVTWAPENNGEKLKQEEENVAQDVLGQRRLQMLEKAGIKVLPAVVRYSSPPAVEEQQERSPSPNIILRRDNDFLTSQKSAWDSSSDGEEESEVRSVPDVRKDDLASRRALRSPVAPKVHQFVPPPVCNDKDRERWEGIRRASQQTLQEKEISEKDASPDIIMRRDNPFLNSAPRNEEEEDEEEEGRVKAMPNKQKDDLARRRAQSRTRPHRDGPMSFVSASMSQADMKKWERLKMTEPSEASPAPVCQACLEKSYGGPFSGSAKAGRGHIKVVTFGGVTEIEQPIDTVTSNEGEETELLRRLLSKATVAMPTIGLGSQLSERERSQVDGADLGQTTPPSAELPPWTPEFAATPAELDARLAQYQSRAEEEEEDEQEQERIPDLQKDDMMARRTGVFHKQSTATVTYNRFLPLPTSKRCTQGETTADAAPRNKKEVQTARNKNLNVRAEQQQPRVHMETPQPQPDTTAVRSVSRSQQEYDDDEDEYDENEAAPDLEKDDMMARRTRSSQKPPAAKTNQCYSRFQFLPVPGSVKYNVSPVSAMKPLHVRPKRAEKSAGESIVTVAAEPQAPLTTTDPSGPKCAALRERQEDGKQEGDVTVPNASFTDLTEPLSSPSLTPPPSPAAAHIRMVEAELEKPSVEEKSEESEKERGNDVTEQPRKKPFWLEDDDLPPIMSMSLGDMLNEEEVGYLPPLSQSRHERMQEQYNSFQEEEDPWRNDLTRWKNRRRSASQELIKKEEERKRIEKSMKEQGGDGNKRKSIKTYKEIVEDKERREVELCEAYRNAATPEEAAMVLQRYALRFTISDATLDSLKLPRSNAKPKSDLSQVDKEHEPSSAVNDSPETSEPPRKPEQTVVTEPEEVEKDAIAQQETSVSVSTSSPTPSIPLTTVTNSENTPPRSLELIEPPSKLTESPMAHQKQPITGDAQPQTKQTPPQTEQVQPHTKQPARALPSPPSVPCRPLPLLAAKPYCQPRSTPSGHKSVKMDGLARVNGEATEDISVTTAPGSPPDSPQENKDITSKQTEKDVPPEETAKNQEKAEQQPPPLQTEKSTSSSGSAISSLIGGRNCVITTTIVTELTQTLVEPHHPEQSNGQVNGTTGLFVTPAQEQKAQPAASANSPQEYSPTVTEGLEESSVTIETPMLNLAKRVNHWVWDPNEERKRLESWQQEQERLLQEQYQREQEKLKKEWEKAQLEVEEEERKHNEEERRILEETVTPLNPTGLLNQQLGKTETISSAPEKSDVPLQQNGQRVSAGNEDQHASKLHFFQDSVCDGEPSKKQELWKTASLDRNLQLNQAHAVKRSGSHDVVTSKQQPPSSASSSSSPQPLSPSRCVSGKRLCSSCSQPLGKGAAMIIDTLGLFFHVQCFKCGVCEGQLGDATAGTDVRIRNGLLSCHECYMASRGRGQPTTL